jgi:hypothetical protein
LAFGHLLQLHLLAAFPVVHEKLAVVANGIAQAFFIARTAGYATDGTLCE